MTTHMCFTKTGLEQPGGTRRPVKGANVETDACAMSKETHRRTEPVRVKAGIGLLPLLRVRAEEGGAQLAHKLQLVRFHRPRSTRGMTHPGNGIAQIGEECAGGK